MNQYLSLTLFIIYFLCAIFFGVKAFEAFYPEPPKVEKRWTNTGGTIDFDHVDGYHVKFMIQCTIDRASGLIEYRVGEELERRPIQREDGK